MAWRSGSMPGVGAYFVLPALSAAMHASLMCSGVSKSGSPAAKPQTSSPAACRALAFASTASVGDGETLRAQIESGAGGLLMDKRSDERVALLEKQARCLTLHDAARVSAGGAALKNKTAPKIWGRVFIEEGGRYF